MPDHDPLVRVLVRDNRKRAGYTCPPDTAVEMPDSHRQKAHTASTHVHAVLVRLADGTRVMAASAYPVRGSQAELELWEPHQALLLLLDGER